MKNGDSPKSSKSKDKKESSEPFEPVAGCSKLPDIVCFADSKKKKIKPTLDPSRRKQNVLSKTKEKKGTTDVAERKETDGNAESSKEINDDDDHEFRRYRHKIKEFEMAIKSCAERIQRLEVAEVDFTSLGEHLQEARPAAADSTLANKLSQNQKVAEKNMSKIFKKYVRKQEAKNAGDQKSTSSESECDDDDDEGEEDEDEKKSKSDVSDTELSDNEDVESSGQTENEKNSTKALETLPESQNKQESLKKDINDETRAIEVEDAIRENNDLENGKTAIEESEKTNLTKETSLVDEPKNVEVNHAENIYEEVIEILNDPLQVQSPHVKMTENVVCSEADPKKKDKKLREVSDPTVIEEKTVEASEEKGDDIPTFSDEMAQPRLLDTKYFPKFIGENAEAMGAFIQQILRAPKDFLPNAGKRAYYKKLSKNIYRNDLTAKRINSITKVFDRHRYHIMQLLLEFATANHKTLTNEVIGKRWLSLINDTTIEESKKWYLENEHRFH